MPETIKELEQRVAKPRSAACANRTDDQVRYVSQRFKSYLLEEKMHFRS